MDWLSRADEILLAVACYVAVMSLMRMMQARRDRLVDDVKRQVEARRQRPKRPQAAEKKTPDQTRGAA